MSVFQAFPTSPVALPKEIRYDLPGSLADDARAYTVHQQPSGQTQVQGASISSTTMSANTAGLQNQAFNSQQISFDIPSGMGPSVFLDTASTTLSFRLTWTVSTASSATNGSVQLIGSGASFIDSLILTSNNTPIETINNYGQLFNVALNSLVNYAERYGGITAMGCDTNSMNGIELANASTGTFYYTFTIPLMSIIGQSTTEKYLPVGLINNLQLLLQTSASLPVTSFCTAVATAPVFGAPVLDQFVLNLKYVDAGASAGSAIMQSLKNGKLYLKSQTYTSSNVTIPNGSSGQVQSLLQIRNSSVKSLIFYHATDKSATAINSYYDAFNPASTRCQVIIAGNRFPQREMNPSVRPSEALMYYMQAWGAHGDNAGYGGVVSRNGYGSTLPSLPSGADAMLVVPSAGVRTPGNGTDASAEYLVKYPNMHYLGVDLERTPGVLFSGISTRANAPYIDENFAVATSATSSILAWGISDVVLEIDAMSKQVIAYI